VAFGQAKSTISGLVMQNDYPVPNATVTLKSKGGRMLTTTTDAAGKYSFIDLEPGDYEVLGHHVRGAISRVISVAPGQSLTLDLDIRLDMRRSYTSAINAFVTVAAGRGQTIEQVSKTVDVIGAQEMRDRADFSLTESLQTIPGFRVQQSGGFGRVATIKSRGLRNQDTALLIDGVRFRDPSAITGDASPFLADLTLTSVSEVEVLRGSGSSLYGTNAIGGVIDLQTPSAPYGTHGQIGGALGGLGLGRFRANLSHGFDSGRLGIGGGVSRTVYTKGVDGDDDAHNTNVQTRVDASPFNLTAVSGSIFYSDADVKLNANPDTTGSLPATNATIIQARPGVTFVPDANDPDSLQQSRFFSGRVSVLQATNSGVTLRGYYHGLDTRRRNDNGPLGPGFQSTSTSIFDGGIHTANAHVNWTKGRNSLTAGYEYETESFGNVGRTPAGTGDFSASVGQRSNTFFANNLLALADDRLQLAGGVRVQRFDLGRPAFSLTGGPYAGTGELADPPAAYTFDASAAYLFRGSGTKIRAHIGNGYRVPSLYERFGTFYSTFGGNRFVALGDPFLKPEKTTAFDFGVEQEVAAKRLRLSATYFYTKLTDIIGFANGVPDIDPLTPRPSGGYLNQSGGISRGLETSAKARIGDKFDLFASYTYTNSDQRTPQVAGTNVYRTLGVPDHQFTLVATKRFGRFWVNFDYLATSDYIATIFSGTRFTSFLYRFEGNRKGDVTAGYTFELRDDGPTLRVFGTVTNVLNQEYYENGFRTPGASGRVGLSMTF
jgi:iron complex outermembrane receptor protein